MKNKTFTVDWDNFEAVCRLLQQVKSRKIELHKRQPENIEKYSWLLKRCLDILDTDISHIYADNLCAEKKFYVYAHCYDKKLFSPRQRHLQMFCKVLGLPSKPFYIGKGTGRRAWDMDRNSYHRCVQKQTANNGREIKVIIVRDNLSEAEAFALESKLIDIFGLISAGGSLLNLDLGVDAACRRACYAPALAALKRL